MVNKVNQIRTANSSLESACMGLPFEENRCVFAYKCSWLMQNYEFVCVIAESRLPRACLLPMKVFVYTYRYVKHEYVSSIRIGSLYMPVKYLKFICWNEWGDRCAPVSYTSHIQTTYVFVCFQCFCAFPRFFCVATLHKIKLSVHTKHRTQKNAEKFKKH